MYSLGCEVAPKNSKDLFGQFVSQPAMNAARMVVEKEIGEEFHWHTTAL